MIFRKKAAPPPALRVRLQHRDLDDSAIEGVWVGTYDGHYHLRAAKTILAGDARPVPVGEILVRGEKVIFLEVLGRDYADVSDPGPGAV